MLTTEHSRGMEIDRPSFSGFLSDCDELSSFGGSSQAPGRGFKAFLS